MPVLSLKTINEEEIPMKQMKVAYLFEDRGLCRDVFQSIEQPGQYFNRSTLNGVWYHTDVSGNYCENSHPAKNDTIFEIYHNGQFWCLDGNGDFENKVPFEPFCQFERNLMHTFQKEHPEVRDYEAMKAKLLSLPGSEAYADPHSCRDNWIYALDFANVTEEVMETCAWMKKQYNILAVRFTHKPTGFVFINSRFRSALLSPGASSHDLLLYSWSE